jgi:predicted permease
MLTLGLAIGANSTMFGIVDRLLLRPPDQVPNAADVRRITVARMFDTGLSDPWDAISYASYVDMRDQTSSFSQVAVIFQTSMSFGLGQEARNVRVVMATGQYFPMLGTPALLGRMFDEAEDRPPDGSPVAVLSWQFWQSAFGGRRDVLGESVRLDGHLYTVIGVAPRGFTGTNLEPVDAWVPFHSMARYQFGPGDGWTTNRGAQFINAYVGLKPGLNETRAAEDLKRAYQSRQEFRFEKEAVPYLGSLIAARTPGASEGTEAPVAAWLLGVAGVVLLIACANVANLVLARGHRRRGEIAVRLALGVPRTRLLRMLLAESLVLALGGAALGLLLTQWGGALVRSTLLPGVSWEGGLDGRVLAITAGVTMLVAVIAGLLPLLRASRSDVAAVLHGAARQVGGAPLQLRAGLLLVQTTLCTALLVGAGLFLRSLDRVVGLDLGLKPDQSLLVSVDLAAVGVPVEEQIAFYRDARQRLLTIPGVTAAGGIQCAPFLCNMGGPIRVPGLDSVPRSPGGGPYYFRVTPGALEALGARLIRGRFFNDGDRAGSPPVAIISERMAQVVWPKQDAIGKCFYKWNERESTSDNTACQEVVGVVADIHRQAIIEEPFLLFFTVLDQEPEPIAPSNLLVGTGEGAPELVADAVRRELQAMRGDLPYISARPFEEVVSPLVRSWRLGATMFTLFAGLSLVIAAVGLYGVLSYLVTQRTAELGIRAALGASPRSLLTMILRSGVLAAAAGVVLGLVLVLLIGNRLSGLLFNTSAREPLVLGGAAVAVLGVAILASLVPGLRATRVDPMQALRAE